MHSIKVVIAAMLAGLLMTFQAYAASVNVDGNGLALKGYDPVAYFTEGKPMKGNASFMVKHEGATYHFSSADNQALFEAEPAKYAPQYGGFCAYGLSYGNKVDVEVDKFKVVDGKLYLNYNGDIQSRWEKDIPGFITKANANWPGLK